MRKLRKAMLIATIFITTLALGIFIFMRRATFGRHPQGERLARIQQSPNYKNGSFQNLIETEVLAKGISQFTLLKEYYNKPPTVNPPQAIPSKKIDLKNLRPDKPTLVWFGHSSYLIKFKDKNILVDPVFSGYSSPVSFLVKAFPGSNIYTVGDLPPIDVVVISHDHYDHLDHETILLLKNTSTKFCVPLGVGEHLEKWGVSADRITELDWWESSTLAQDVKITATPARHFSGRSVARFKTLWASYALELYGTKIFIGGDSGYDASFKTIGEKFGGFDIAMLEAGQYNERWPLIHMMPEETVQAAKDLRAKMLLPVHWGKFVLSLHPWNEPIRRVKLSAAVQKQKLTTPIIGEVIYIGGIYPDSVWWEF